MTRLHELALKGRIARPSTYKTEYHGNGPRAWYGEEISVNGHVLRYESVRYSYRWHKTRVYFDGVQLRTASDYAKAEAALKAVADFRVAE